MKLFAYKFDGQGKCSFFTMAENEEQAFNNIQSYIDHSSYCKNISCNYCKEYVNIKDKTYYYMMELNENEVITNENK